MQALQQWLEQVRAEDIHAGYLSHGHAQPGDRHPRTGCDTTACLARKTIGRVTLQRYGAGIPGERGACLVGIQRPLRGGQSSWIDVCGDAMSCAAASLLQQARN